MNIGFQSVRAFFVTGAIALASVHAFDAWAEPAPCVLYTNDASHENVAAWNSLGFRIEERKDLETSSPEQRAKLLDDTHYGLIRRTSADVMWLSTTHGKFSQGWMPAEFKAPARGARPDDRYGCTALRTHLPFYEESRRAVADVMSLAMNGRIHRTVGEAVLDLERYYLVPAGFARYQKTNAKAAYLTLLEQVRAAREVYADDFDLFWLNVRQLVYSKYQSNVRYCDEYASMTTALVDKCTNCVGESYLMAALFMDSGAVPPRGFQFGIQAFRDHLRPVLYNLETRKTLDLVNGGVGPFRSSIVKPNALWRALWLGGRTLRLDDEFARVRAVPIEIVYRDWTCVIKPTLVLRYPLQSADLNGLSGCQSFIENYRNPHRADNQSKTQKASFDETKTKADEKGNLVNGDEPVESKEFGGATDSKEPRADGRSGEGNASPGNWFMTAIGSVLGSGTPKPHTGGGLSDGYRQAFEYVAPNLNPADRALVDADLKRGSASKELVDLVSEDSFIRAAGLGHFLESFRDNYALSLIPLVNPIFVRTFGDNSSDDKADYLSSATFKDTRILQSNSFALEVTSTDEKLIRMLKAASLPERVRILIRVASRDLEPDLDAIIAAGWPMSDPQTTLDRAVENDRIREALSHLSVKLTAIRRFQTNFSGKKLNTPDGLFDVLPTTVAYMFDANVRLRSVIKPILSAIRELRAAPVETVRTASTGPEANRRLLGDDGIVNSLGSILQSLNLLYSTDRRFAEWRTYPSLDQVVAGDLLFAILTDERFFFTVQPERDEIVSKRPIYPLQILDPRVLEILRASENRRAAQINLPVWSNFQCPPGAKGLYGSGVVVECGRGADGETTNEYLDTKNQDGVERGSPDGRPAPGINGKDQRSRAGFTSQKTAGRDQAPGRVLESPLSIEQQRIRTSPHATRIVRSQNEAGDSLGDIDPRQEVDLSPEVWMNLVAGPSEVLIVEPVVQILLHHAYRKRLAPVFDFGSFASNVRILNMSTLRRPDFVLSRNGPAKDVNLDDRSELSARLDMVKYQALIDAEGYDLYEGQGKKKFFAVALGELDRPKDGFWVLNGESRPTSKAELDGLFARLNERGGTLPLAMRIDGFDYLSLGYKLVDGTILKSFPNLSVQPKLTTWNGAPLWNAKGELLGLRLLRGQGFGHPHFVYYSRSLRDRSPQERVAQALADMFYSVKIELIPSGPRETADKASR